MKKDKKSYERITADIETGLSSAQVLERNELGLSNRTKKSFSKSYLSIFLGNIFTFFNLLGAIITVALAFSGAKPMDFVFVVVYLANIAIGIIQEIRAKISIDKLSLVSNKNTKVIRDNKIKTISSLDVVLDDIIMLGLGSQVPADSYIIQGEVEANESILTGESDSVKKAEGDMILKGSYITSGTCYVRAEKVGKKNYVEKLAAQAKKYKKPHSELMDSLRIIIRSIGIAIIPMALLFLMKSIFITKLDIKVSILHTSTVVIGMIPSGMFLLTSMALAVGIIKLAKVNTLVQDLYSLEMLARVDTICFDKTGTITDGRMNVKDLVVLDKKYKEKAKTIISSMIGTLKDNNQTSIALFNAFGHDVKLDAIASIPFNSKRKLSAVTFKKEGTFAFGAPEFILPSDEFKKIEGSINQYASKGMRVLVLAQSSKQIENDEIPDDFIPIALILIVDNIREDAFATVKWFKENGVEIKVISGDNPITVSEVSKRVGIENADKYVNLDGFSDNQVIEAAKKYTVFGRVTPEQKAVLIKALKTFGHTTAMTGDGVNDVLALKEADCAISVASGSEAARNIAHIVLMDNNFSSMPKVVCEGRRVINNVQCSSSLYLMKTMFTILIAIFSLAFELNYPFTLKQMNILELLVIGLPSFFLSLQPNESLVTGTFLGNVLKKSLSSSILMSISVLIIYIAKEAIGIDDVVYTKDVYTTLEVFALTYAGLVSLHKVCRPMNLYRGILFVVVLVLLLLITIIIIFFGLDFIGMTKLSPFSLYWQHMLIVVASILFDISIENQINKFVDYLTKNQMKKKLDKNKNSK